MNKNNIRSFAGLFPHVDIPYVNRVRRFLTLTIPEVSSDSPESMLLGTIFAPDSENGFPSSDISVYLSDKTNVNVRDYIQKYLFNELPDSPSMVKDSDSALDSVVSTRVQSMADWREVQKDLVKIADLSKEEYKTFLAEKRVNESKSV